MKHAPGQLRLFDPPSRSARVDTIRRAIALELAKPDPCSICRGSKRGAHVHSGVHGRVHKRCLDSRPVQV